MDGHQIGAVVASSLTAWNRVVDVDVLPIEQRLATVGTPSLLLPDNLLSGFGVVFYLLRALGSLLEIIPTIGIIRAGLALDEDMPLNASIADAIEHHARVLVHKTPLTTGIGRMIGPVAPVAPGEGFSGMGLTNPASEFPEDVIFQLMEGFRADDTSVVVSPTSDDGVEHFNQTPGIAAMEPLEGKAYFLTKVCHTRLGGLDQQFPSTAGGAATVVTDVEPQKVEPFR